MSATSPTSNAREKRPTELTRADFGEWDFDAVVEAVYPVMAEVQDIHHHRMAGTEWTPYIERGQMPQLIAECRAILAQLEKPIKEARVRLAHIEGGARLRAHRRVKNGPDHDNADRSEREYLDAAERQAAADAAEALDLPSGRYPEQRLGGEL
ncbi:hypothetical protein [Nonomuraea sp. NPDC049750]|uniref:hypothetical protein n=1 Tax=Nonomuraea sp. NPDC049750 TaxID=3154738 RepID=UPI0033FA0F45